MWTPSFHRFDNQAAFLAACDAAGWPRDHQNQPTPPLGVVLDIIGPLPDPATVVGGIPIPGAIDPRWHVNAAWHSGHTMPAAWAAAEVIPEQPARMFAVRDMPAQLARFKAMFDARRASRADDPQLVARGGRG